MSRRGLVERGILIVLFLPLLSGNRSSDAEAILPSKTPRTPQWRLVIRATHILHGTLKKPVAGSWETSGENYASFRIEPAEALKGELATRSVTIQSYIPIAPGRITQLDSLLDTEVIVFAEKVKMMGSNKDAFFAFNEDPDTILRSTPRIVASVKEEMKHQDKMGSKAVPSLIRLMNDRRALPQELIAFRNKPRPPGAPPTGSPADFESHAYYMPKTVVDAVATILSLITGAPRSNGKQ